jgi:uncharacterized protein YecT (DUF1311 family)
MRIMHLLGGMALVALGALPVSAQRAATEAEIAARYTPGLERCLNSGAALQGVTPAMRKCNADELAIQDARLNAAYRAAMLRLAPNRRDTLRASERAWVIARDRNCQAEAAREGGGGTMTPVVLGGCLLHETISRTIWLERYR